MPETIAKPEGISEEVLEDAKDFLNNLRESGITNMFGASPYLVDKFGISSKQAREILSYWMRTFEG